MTSFFKNRRDILGMNARNLLYTRPNNLARARRLADNKLRSKYVLRKADLPVPNLISKISSREELENFDWKSLPGSFVLKPNLGFGGEGILVVYGKKKNHEDIWIKADGSLVKTEDLKTHVQNILDGGFSISGIQDTAFFEERMKLLKLFKPYSYKGIPDIRIIVYNKVPVMAMLRLPTRESDGKANLQLGAIGAGIDMATGVTTTAVFGKGKIIEYIPKTRLILSGIKIPYWKNILLMAVRAQVISRLGFLGADVAIDRDRGPVFLELNARPGLSIQIANLDGLLGRLRRVAGLKIKTAEKGVAVGMNLFGGEIEEEIEDISGKKIISTVEKVKLIGKDGKEIEVEAKIDTGASSTSLDIEFAKQLGYERTIDMFSGIDLSQYELSPENESSIKKDFLERYKNEIQDLEDISIIFSASGSSIRPVIKIELEMDKEKLVSKANIVDRKNMKYPIIIGKRDLKKFLIEVK